MKKIPAILLAFIISLTFIPQVSAGTLTGAKLQINNSQAGASAVTYSFFWTTTATTAIKQIDISICTTGSGSCSAPGGFGSGSPTLASDNIAGSGRTVSAPSANAFRVVVSSASSQSTQAMFLNFTGVTNPSGINTTYFARITTYSDTGSTTIDTSTVAFATLDTNSIAVSATYEDTFSFSIAAVNSGGSVNSSVTNITTTASTIPFGTIPAATPKIAAHDVTITTNSQNGYTVTASASATPPLTSASNDIDAFTGTNASPATWSSPNGSTANTNTGFFGYTTEDSSLCTGTGSRFSSNKWAGTTTTGLEIICNSAAATAETTRIGWQAEVNAIQPAGSYTGTVILIATPTY